MEIGRSFYSRRRKDPQSRKGTRVLRWTKLEWEYCRLISINVPRVRPISTNSSTWDGVRRTRRVPERRWVRYEPLGTRDTFPSPLCNGTSRSIPNVRKIHLVNDMIVRGIYKNYFRRLNVNKKEYHNQDGVTCQDMINL